MRHCLCAATRRRWELLALVLLIGCASADDPVGEVDQEDESVTAIVGHVEPAEAGIGVIAVRNGVQTAITQTDESGDYRFVDPLVGEYSLIVSTGGFFTDTSVRHLVVERGLEAHAPPVELRPLSAAVKLRGQAVAADTAIGLAGVRVTIECRSGICSNLSVITDAQGQFQTEIWPGLDANLIFERDGYHAQLRQVKAQPPNAVVNVPPVTMEATNLDVPPEA